MNIVKKLVCGVISAAVALGAASAWATDYTWNTVADGDWEEPSNWSPSTGYPSAAGDTATIPNPVNSEGAGSSYTVTVNSPFSIAGLSVAGTAGHDGAVTLLFKTGYSTNAVSGDISIGNHAIITHFGPNTTRDHSVVLKSGGDFAIAAGALVDVTQKGYAFVQNKNGYGPGAGRDNGRYGGEASTQWSYGKVHGSMRHPVDYGGSVWYPGANSAGAVHFIAGGTLTLNGSIVANGVGDTTCGSAGGSVWIECAEFAGSGSISTIGGAGSWDLCGSGGRIAIYQTATSGWTSFTGSYATAHGTTGSAAGGTLYLEDASDTPGEGTLIVDNANNTRNSSYCVPLNFNMDDGTNVLGRVVLRNRGRLRVVPGLTLKVTKGIEVASNCAVLTDAGGAIEFVGSEDATVTGGSLITVESLICTNAGKTIRFGTAAADKITIPLGKTLILKGTPGNPVTLASTTDGTRWPISVDANAGLVDIVNVAVQDSDASSGAAILAIDSTDLGNNRYWGFSAPIVPGAAIEWTGAEDTAWQNPANWSPARVPVDTDVITIPAVSSAKYPILGAGTFLFNQLSVGAGASLTFSGPTVTFTNTVAVAGTLSFAGSESVYFAGDLLFSGAGTVVRGSSLFYITGTGDQTLDFNGATLNKIYFQKPSGNVSFGSHGFTAELISCAATVPVEFEFAAGETYTFAAMDLKGYVGGTQCITLKSSVPGTQWILDADGDNASVVGVRVSDSDASAGGTIYAGTSSVSVSNNLNWDCVTDIAVWIGGTTGSFTAATSWSTGVVPGPDTQVMISAGDGETVKATLPAGTPMTFKSLTAKAGAGGKATFVADSAVTIRDALDIRANGIVELNVFDENGEAPNVVSNSVRIRAGGVLSHTGPNDTETKKLHLRCLGTFTVDAGGAVDVTAKGYTERHGIGWTRCYPFHAGTASDYAAQGSYAGKYTYGSVRLPTEYGAGAGAGEGTYGGGTAILEVPGVIDLAGSLVSTGNWHTISGGAGGSILLRCGAIAGNGLISAAGGNGRSNQGNFSGSGGRIAIYRTDAARLNDFTGTITTMYNKPASASVSSACGTIYYENPGDEPGRGTLVVDNGGYSVGFYTDFNTYVTDASLPFGTVVVTNNAKLRISEGANLRATKGIMVANGSSITTVAGTVVELCGTNDAVLVGASRITVNGLICTNVEKRVYFETGAAGKITIPSDIQLTLSGQDSAHPLSLLPLGGSGTWQLQVDANAVQDVSNVAVQNSDASSGAAVLAIDSTDLGGNSYWSFSSVIVPGETIVWTGGASTDWADGDNWDLGRAPVETDDVRIPSAGENNPTLSTGTYLFNQVRIEPGATLTLDGATLTVTNLMLNSGTLAFTADETLYLTGDAFFTNGTVVAAQSYVRIAGTGAQAIDFGNTSVGKVYVENSTGPLSFTGHGFAAKSFTCYASSSIAMSFEPGALYDFEQCHVSGANAESSITLASRVGGSRWRLKVYENAHGFGRLAVSDCDASAGAVARGGRTSVNSGNNLNWDFTTDVAVWTGGASGDFDNAANWSSGTVPSRDSHVVIEASDGETVAVTMPSESPTTIASLIVGAGVGGSATLTAQSAITVCGDAEVRSGGTLVLDAYNDAGAAPNVVSNDFRVLSGGIVTHSGPATTENAKIHLAVFGDMTIDTDAKVTADAKGYSSNYSPAGYEGSQHGAVHAGYANVELCEPYGSILRPVNWGAAGGASINGGGAIHLVVSGDLVVNGSITANGTGEQFYAGCGGSIWLECASLTGSGTISARESVTSMLNANYTASGGRVAVYQRAVRDFTAFPKSRILATTGSNNSCGTVYLEGSDPSRGGDLYVESGRADRTSYATCFPMADDGNAKTAYRNVNLIIGQGGWLKVARGEGNVPQRIRLRSLTLSDASSRLDLGVNFLEVYDPGRRKDLDWSPSATVNVEAYNTVYGEVIWLKLGFSLIVR